jgi:ribosomal protein L11 methyltransferase
MTPTYAIHIDTASQEEQEILMAILSEAGFDAFEQVPGKLIGYCTQETYEASKYTDLLLNRNWSVQTIGPQNWNSKWEASFEPVIIKNFCGIRASFHPPLSNVKHEIIITPKMSFGTGHHATTWLMIDQMSKLEFAGKSVLDFGTGTGVLAILAEKLGAEKIIAIDNDDWSIDNSKENLDFNHCMKVLLEKASNLSGYSSFDIILANINKHVLIDQMQAIKQHLGEQGVVVFSGLLAGDREEMIEHAKVHSLSLLEAQEKDNWISLAFSHKA